MSGSTGRTLFTLGGQILGAVFGPVGAAVGGGIGSALGWALFPENTTVEGPRLNDLKITTSAYGEGLPVVLGGMRVAGKLIWASAIREQRNEQEVGGKGGPTQTQVTYRYFVDFAMALCDRTADEGGIAGVARIWVDGQLKYDLSAGATAAAIAASGQFAAGMQIYAGSQTQLPDPTIEAAKGVGNAPAYRGVAYLVFVNLDITDYGARIPNIEVELVTDGTAAGVRRTAFSALGAPGGSSDPIIFSAGNGVVRWGFTNGSRAAVHGMDAVLVANDRRNFFEKGFPAWGFTGSPKLSSMYGMFRLQDGARLWADLPAGVTFASGNARIVVERSNGSTVSVAALVPNQAEFFYGVTVDATATHILVLAGPASMVPVTKWYLFRWSGSNASLVDSGTCDTSVIVNGPQRIYGPMGAGFGEAGFLEGDRRHFWIIKPNEQPGVWLWRIDSDNVMRFVAQPAAGWELTDVGPNPCAAFADGGVCFAINSTRMYSFTRLVAPTPSLTVGEAVRRICRRAGYTEPQLNTAALTDSLSGYALAQPTAARNALQPLQQAYWFDAVESAGVLKFVKRGGAPVKTLPADDLVLLESGAGADRVPTERTRASEPPRQVAVTYYAVGADYQQGAQSDMRASGVSQQLLNVALPIALTDTAAKRVASVLLYDAWQQRSRRRLATWRKHADLEATDVITVPTDTATLTLRIDKRTDRGALIELDCVDEAAAVYSKTATGAATPGAGALTGVASVTRYELMDTPLLQDADDYNGFYAAYRGYTSPWPGARLFRSLDSGNSYAAIDVATTEAVIGSATTVLGNYTAVQAIDEFNSVTVDLISGTLSTVTLAQLYAGANAALLGDEIIQFRTATLVSGKTWTLSGLLRGRQGTEQYIGTHAVDERFVLLEAGKLSRVAANVTENNADFDYKAVTAGQSITSVPLQVFRNTGAALKPYSPVQLRATRAGSNDVNLAWVRRGRLSNGWVDGVDVPLGEAAEAYEVEILNVATGVVLRTIAGLTTPSATWTSAQQTTDVGGVATQVRFRVYQLSATVGRGFPAEITRNV